MNKDNNEVKETKETKAEDTKPPLVIRAYRHNVKRRRKQTKSQKAGASRNPWISFVRSFWCNGENGFSYSEAMKVAAESGLYYKYRQSLNY